MRFLEDLKLPLPKLPDERNMTDSGARKSELEEEEEEVMVYQEEEASHQYRKATNRFLTIVGLTMVYYVMLT